MNKPFAEAALLINATESIVLAAHVQPDGDAFGSLLAMATCLKQTGKNVCSTWGEEIRIPPQYQWMPGIDTVVDCRQCTEGDLLITLDCANERRLGMMESSLPGFKSIINIDHHVDNSNFGTINILDFYASATAEIVYQLLRFMNADIDSDVATLLYAGIVTDTGRFQYQNTTAQTLRIATELVEFGVIPNNIFHKIYENLSFSTLKLLARVLDRAKYIAESKLIYSYTLNGDLKETGADMGDTENFIDYLRMAKESNVAAIFKEVPGAGLRVSLRSKGSIDVGAIAREKSGGGHRNAAGATLNIPIADAVEWLSTRIIAQTSASISINE
ncbi:MAG TPA: bifunctional oligoribonuclease/PAP phosphatase NrnA [Candidatus Aquicultor sp.]|jgi:phosphoesterase RecJ-like protein